MTEDEIRKTVKDEFERLYKRVFPTFVMSGGAPTEKHGKSEFCVTTQSAQGIHFYEGGIGKIRAGKNLEIYSGDDASIGDGKVTGEGGVAFKIECKHGRIFITSKASDIELNGRNIVLAAKKNIYIDAGDNVRMRSGSQTDILAGADMNFDSGRELFINGGAAVGIHCEASFIETTSGVDLDIAPDFFDQLSSFYGGLPVDKITKFNDPSGGLD